jgi:energy-converting hydrogenase Eha subunit A
MKWRIAGVISAVVAVVGVIVGVVLGLRGRRPAKERQRAEESVWERLIALGVRPSFVKVTGDRRGGPDLCHVSLTVDQWHAILGAKPSDEPSASSETPE